MQETTLAETAKATPQLLDTFKALQYQVKGLLTAADARTIKEDSDLLPATDDLALIGKLSKTLELKRKECVAPLRAKVDAFNQMFKQLSEPLMEAKRLTNGKILAYQAEIAEKRRKQEELNRLKMETAQAEAELSGTGEITESVGLVEVVPEAASKVSTFSGTLSTRANWKYRVVDIEKVPRAYMVIDSSQLTAIAKHHHDLKPIPGIEFYNEPGLATRPR